MNGPELPTTPQGSRLIVKQFADGIEITRPPVGWRGVLTRRPFLFLFLLVLIWLFRNAQSNLQSPTDALLEADEPLFAAISLLLVFVFWGSVLSIVTIVIATLTARRLRLQATPEQLIAGRSYLFLRRRWTWDRGDLRGIRATERGLCICDTRAEVLLFARADPRDAEDFAWMARVSRQYFGLVGNPAGPDEIPPATVRSGFLGVAPGSLTLRDEFGEEVPRYFVAVQDGELFVSLSHKIPLKAIDTLCRVEDDGRAVLQIVPTRGNLFWTIWCDEPDALPRALARFWGAAE
jgi:hypothetical protein